MFVVRSNNIINANLYRATDYYCRQMANSTLIILIIILVLAQSIVHQVDAGRIGRIDSLSANNDNQADQAKSADQWTQDDLVCEEIEKNYAQVCECIYEPTRNKLKLVCDGKSSPTSATKLYGTFELLSKYDIDGVLQPDEIVLSNIVSLNASNLPNIGFSVLRIFNSPQLSAIESIDAIPLKVANSLETLEIVNTTLGEGVFHFIRKFQYLNTVLMSDLQLGATLSSTAFRTGHCLDHLYRFALNHRCSKPATPLTTITPRVFSDLCHVAMLELSCLGLTHLSNESLYMNAPEKINKSSQMTKIYIDLSYNKLDTISSAVSDAIDIQSRRQIDTIYLNADHNPVRTLSQSLVTNFVHHQKNKLRVWQGPDETVLDCGNCANRWLASPSIDFESFCRTSGAASFKTESRTGESILVDDDKAFAHCTERNDL